MNRIKWIFTGFCALGVILLTACNRPKMIPDDVMREIIREELVIQSIAVNHNDQSLRPSDSLDLHTEALKKHGYTLADFQHTIREMSLRKSNPLGAILNAVMTDIKTQSEVAEYRYRTKLKLDSVAVAYTADTVYRNDTVISGNWGEHTFIYSEAGIFFDSVVPEGKYWVEFNYSTGDHADLYTKALRYKRIMQNEKTSRGENNMWVRPAKDTTLFHGEIEIADNVRRLELIFRDLPRAASGEKKALPDTCYLTDLKLIRILPVNEARQEYYYRLIGVRPLEDYYYERILDSLQNLRGPISLRPAGPVEAQ